MNLARYNQPLPPRVGQFLLLANVILLAVSGSSLMSNHPTAAAWVLLLTGISNQAVLIFVGQKPTPGNEEVSVDSTLSNRRERMQKERKARSAKRRPAEGGAT